MLLTEAGARQYFPDSSPFGHRVRYRGTTREIVGNVSNERFHGLSEDEPSAIYPPIWQTPMAAGSILLRTSADPLSSVTSLRTAVATIDPALALYAIETMDQAIAQSLARERFTMLLLGLFAAAALLLAVIGVHGVLSYTVAQRTHEVGIRVALGASRSSVVGLVVRQALGLALLGISIGLAGAWAGSRVLASLLYGVTTTDAATFAGVTVLMVAVSAFACWLPARRASGIDPMAALRSE
jgi:putative ABC transport system permease protein